MLRALLLSLALTLVALPVLAQATIPKEIANVPDQREPLFPDDERLAKIVRMRAKKWTLYQALYRIGETVEARIVPTRSLVDEPLMASVEAQTARELMDEIATLFGYTWRRTGKPGQWSYLLFQDLKSKQEEEDLRNGAERLVEAALRQEVEKRLQALKLPQDQLQERVRKSDERLKQALEGGLQGLASPGGQRAMMNDQVFRDAASPTGRIMLNLFSRLSPAQWDTLRDVGALYFSTRPESGETMLPQDLATRLGASKPGMALPRALFDAMGPQVTESFAKMEQAQEEAWNARTGIRVTVKMSLMLSESPIGMLTATPIPLGQEHPELFLISGLMVTTAPIHLQESMVDQEARNSALAAHPVLGKMAALKMPERKAQEGNPFLALLQGPTSGELLQIIGDAYHVNLIGDSYTRQALAITELKSGVEIPLYEALDGLAGLGREWEWDGNFVRFRSKTWAFDRRAEIPLRLTRSWIERRRQRGRLSLDDLANIAVSLRDEQLDGLILAIIEAGGDGSDFTSMIGLQTGRDVLRVYGSLIPPQRIALRRGDALPVARLFPYQQERVRALFAPKKNSIMGFMRSIKPPRSLELIAGSVLQMQGPNRPARNGQTPPPRKPNDPEIWRFEFLFPNGEKDQHMVFIPGPGGLPGLGGAPLPMPTAEGATQ